MLSSAAVEPTDPFFVEVGILDVHSSNNVFLTLKMATAGPSSSFSLRISSSLNVPN